MITCFKLNWYDCGLSCVEDKVQEEITIYRNDSYLSYKELNGYGVICSCKIIHIEKEKVDAFFAFLEKISDKWEDNYKVEVCDGSEWQVRMWHYEVRPRQVCHVRSHLSQMPLNVSYASYCTSLPPFRPYTCQIPSTNKAER